MSVRCVVVPPGEGAREIEVPGDLEDYQDLVCGYIDALPYPNGLLCLFDEEGTVRGAPVNRAVPELGARTVDGFFRGPLVFVRRNGGEFDSLEDDDVAALLWRFRDPADVGAHRSAAGLHR